MPVVFRPAQKETQRDDMNTQMAQRREFLKRALVTTVYSAPIVMSFSSTELVRAASGGRQPNPQDPEPNPPRQPNPQDPVPNPPRQRP
jgi:hypothetical protein